MKNIVRTKLLATTMLLSFASPALAQEAASPVPEAIPDDTQAETSAGSEIVVTGTLLRRTNSETPSPVTVLSAETLDQRGLNTVAEAIQRIPANGMGAITQGWNNGNNFASGANAVSLRGLTVQSTLTLFDGMRMAPYPLADDGHRNFVDLNTIPSAIIERIEILRDGASSTYGADAVAGVVNVITKKEIQGVHLNGSAGISQQGDADEQRIDATLGYGDLSADGFNVYVNGEYQRQSTLYARDRGYPFNTSDFSRDCAPSIGRDPGTLGPSDPGVPAGTQTCRANGVLNGIQADGTFNGLFATQIPVVRQVDASGAPLGRFNLLNPQAGCGPLTPVTVDPSQSNTAGALQCSRDNRAMYSTLLPRQERFGGAIRFTARIGDDHEFYAAGNYYQVDTDTQNAPGNFAGTTPPPTRFTLNPLYLPVYVCPTGNGTTDMLDTGCDASNGALNPNNPFAESGNRAQILVGYDRPRELTTSARSLRGAMGLTGTFGRVWDYNLDFTVSNVQLDVTNRNVLIPGRVMDAIARGTYDFLNPGSNSEEARAFIAPVNRNRSNSDLWQVSGTLARELFELPGGPLALAIGASYRHESINNPSANPANDEDPASRYYILNAVGAIGSRNVMSGFFELGAPILDTLEVNLSGRYDDYSSGQSNFSPKIGAKFTPIRELAIRGTFSKGFRIPSFNEAYGLPTTGFVTRQLSPNTPGYADFVASHGGNAFATGQFAVGQTSIGNPELDPEKSTSWTLGAIFEPTRNLSFTVDYFNIKIDDMIANATYDVDEVFAQYYGNNGVVDIPGVVVRPGLADVNFPNALPHIGFIEASFQNTDSQKVSGIDFGANFTMPLTDDLRLFSNLDVSYLINFERIYPDRVESYEGTLSPCDVTSCSGSPRLRGSWQNTLQYQNTTATITAYYTSGYDLASVDYGGTKGDCLANIGASVVTYRDSVTPVLCEADPTWNVDFTLRQRISDAFTISLDVMNVLDIDPTFDPSAAYSIFQYNPAWNGPNIMGRYFRIGAKVDF